MTKVRLISLGGVGEVTGNMFVYEDMGSGDILIVDCGIGFPDEEMGAEVSIPNISYLRGKTERIKGVLVTHGHEDHFGALRYLYNDLGRPKIFATRLVAGLIKAKFEPSVDGQKVDFFIFDSSRDRWRVGVFGVEAFGVTHSVPDSVGYLIKTPVGSVLHLSDYKFDWTPVIGNYFDVQKLSRLVGQTRPVLMLSDCLGATKAGYSRSEDDIEETFDNLLHHSNNKAVLMTTISSNISRIQQMINASFRHGRKLVLVGFSIRRNVEVAQKLGYLKIPKRMLIKNLKQAREYSPSKLVYIVAGCYGQKNSALSRIARGAHDRVKIDNGEKTTVVFAGDPSPPGTDVAVNLVVDQLSKLGVEVYYYEIQENFHVSGHASSGDMQLLFAMVKPRYFLPIGGDPRYMVAYERLAVKMGFDKARIFSQISSGEILEIEKLRDSIRVTVGLRDKIEVRPVLIETEDRGA